MVNNQIAEVPQNSAFVPQWNQFLKVLMIEKLAEADFRLSEGANSRIQIEAVVASFAILGRNLNKT